MFRLQTTSDAKNVISDFVISQKIKKVIADVHKKLNRPMIAKTS